MTHYDYFVIGAGSGGVSSSRLAASYGAKVGIAEADQVGGTCVIRGCVPKKLLVYASHYGEEITGAQGYGWDTSAVTMEAFDWARLIQYKDQEIQRLNGIYLAMLDKAGVTLHQGKARFIDQHTLEVNDTLITADHIVIATGGVPSLPAIEGIDHAITSNEAFHLPQLPREIIIVGGGYIALEFAGIFNGLGSNVTLLYRGEKILKGFDADIQDFLTEELIKKGIHIRTQTNVTQIQKDVSSGIVTASLTDGTELQAEQIMYCTGRKPNIQHLGLENIGVKYDPQSHAVLVNEQSQTNISHIYAVGDVTDHITLTPVAIKQGRQLANRLFANNILTIDQYDRNMVPTAVFSQPPVGTVGLTEQEAVEKYHDVDVYQSSFKPMKHTLAGSNERCMMKLIVRKSNEQVVGVHMVGADAAEIIQGFGVALCAGATKSHFDHTVAIHPSSAEEFVTMRTPIKKIRDKKLL